MYPPQVLDERQQDNVVQRHGQRPTLRHALHGEDDEAGKAGTPNVQALLVAVRVERKPRYLRPAMADGPQHGEAAQVVEAVGGVDKEEELCLLLPRVVCRHLQSLLPGLREQSGPLLRRSEYVCVCV